MFQEYCIKAKWGNKLSLTWRVKILHNSKPITCALFVVLLFIKWFTKNGWILILVKLNIMFFFRKMNSRNHQYYPTIFGSYTPINHKKSTLCKSSEMLLKLCILKNLSKTNKKTRFKGHNLGHKLRCVLECRKC